MGIHHLITGSYTKTNLYLLAFDTIARTLTLNSTVPAFGLHHSGGSGARINAVDTDGGLGEQTVEMFYVPEEEIVNVDKTRNAVLYGAHSFDVNVNNKGFVAHLAWNAIFMYDIAENGTGALLSVNLSPEIGDGPRNAFPSVDGKWLYVMTEHSQHLDVYEIGETRLTHRQRASAIPDEMRGKHTYRGNTARLSRDGKYIFTSTRGWNSTEANGWVGAFALRENGTLQSEEALTYYEAPLTLGSAGGLRVAFWEDETNAGAYGVTDYMYLSDTQEGYMYILGWTPSNHTISQVAALQYPDGASPYEAAWLD
ncbi:hypothetical protein PG999_001551 [Apiospora kogelbergensis]|uniref:Lactonase, 7-bladed beta-propeller n=1 Tax=Apiospora kogelbergensis TaxID=1337665 RepID=A0AAW0R5U7_9PEZI